MTKSRILDSPSRLAGPGVLFCLSAFLLFTACEDPSNVGIGLVDQDEGGLPDVRTVDPTAFENAPLPRATGSAVRVLAGRVEDPIVGTMEAEGYVDLSSSATSSFRENDIESASLRLNPTYVYGDTTALVTFAVRQITETWPSSALPTDTSLAVGSVILEFDFMPTDSLVIVSLPQDWISENDGVLRSEDFGDEFHGFRFEHISGNAVVGFAGESQLRAFTSADSADFSVNRAYSAARRLSETDFPERLLYQVSAGPIVTFQLNLADDTLSNAAINHARLVFYTDSLTLSNTPNGFHRPVISTLDLYGIEEDGSFRPIERANLDADGRFIFEGRDPFPGSRGIAVELQAAQLGTRTYDRFELRLPLEQGAFGDPRLPPDLSSINVQLFYDENSGERAPAGFFTVTPLD